MCMTVLHYGKLSMCYHFLQHTAFYHDLNSQASLSLTSFYGEPFAMVSFHHRCSNRFFVICEYFWLTVGYSFSVIFWTVPLTTTRRWTPVRRNSPIYNTVTFGYYGDDDSDQLSLLIRIGPVVRPKYTKPWKKTEISSSCLMWILLHICYFSLW